MLRQQGDAPRAADARLAGLSVAAKNELLFGHGVNVNDLPASQKRGVGLIWEHYEVEGVNPTSGEATTTQRRRLVVIEELPVREAYADWIGQIIAAASAF